MAVTLDPATEARIQRKIDEGNFRGPAQVMARALRPLDDESGRRTTKQTKIDFSPPAWPQPNATNSILLSKPAEPSLSVAPQRGGKVRA